MKVEILNNINSRIKVEIFNDIINGLRTKVEIFGVIIHRFRMHSCTSLETKMSVHAQRLFLPGNKDAF